ncbi:MAG: hypothetical protein QM813_12860 [Verrucomicrobiota bacterium]
MATSSYAILLRDTATLSADPIRRAFGTFSHLTAADAIRLAANAQGILMRHLSVDEAKALQQALVKEGVNAVLVNDDDLRFLPMCQRLHRIELTHDALMISDYVGRPTAVAWNEISLVAAGAVPHVELSAAQTQRTALRPHPVFGMWPKKVKEVRSRLETERQFILELVVGRGAARYEIQAHEFPFTGVVDRPTATLMEKFVWLVREMTRRAPQALLNRGAQDVRDGVALVRGYPSRQLLLDEMVWLLWNRTQGQPAV